MIVHHEFLNNEIHVKIGGDHGGGSFKMSLQIVNTANPNSKDNTISAHLRQKITESIY